MTDREKAVALVNIWLEVGGNYYDLAGIILAAIRQEREACALLAYGYPAPDPGGSWRESIGAAIRRREAT